MVRRPEDSRASCCLRLDATAIAEAVQFAVVTHPKSSANWFQERKNTLAGLRSHTAPLGWKNKLATKENSDRPNAHSPRQATSV